MLMPVYQTPYPYNTRLCNFKQLLLIQRVKNSMAVLYCTFLDCKVEYLFLGVLAICMLQSAYFY